MCCISFATHHLIVAAQTESRDPEKPYTRLCIWHRQTYCLVATKNQRDKVLSLPHTTHIAVIGLTVVVRAAIAEIDDPRIARIVRTRSSTPIVVRGSIGKYSSYRWIDSAIVHYA